jgi:hypothetical protein
MLARLAPQTGHESPDKETLGLIQRAFRTFPTLSEKMLPSSTEARRLNRALNLSPLPGQTQQQVGVLKLNNELHSAVKIFAAKLSKAVYYLTNDSKQIFPAHGCLLFKWFTNVDLIRNGAYPVFEALREVTGVSPELVRSKTTLNNQFEYKMSLASKHEIFVLQARFGASFGFVVFGSTVESLLENRLLRLQQQTGHKSPFVKIQ